MNTGHYHIEVEADEDAGPDADGFPPEPEAINEPSLSDAIRKAAATGRRPVYAAFICSYGCGADHALTAAEEAEVRAAFPGFDNFGPR